MHQQRKHWHPRGCRDNDGDMPAGRLSYQHCCLTADRPRSKPLALVLCPQECVASEGGPANLSDLAGELCANQDPPRSPARHPLPHRWAGLTPLGIVPSLAPSPAGSVDLSSLSAPTELCPISGSLSPAPHFFPGFGHCLFALVRLSLSPAPSLQGLGLPANVPWTFTPGTPMGSPPNPSPLVQARLSIIYPPSCSPPSEGPTGTHCWAEI